MKQLMVCLALMLGLAACDGDAGATSDPTKTFTPTATGMDTPSSSSANSSPSGPVEPTLPAAAKEPTKAGAEAFVEYYFDEVTYAVTSGDTKRLRTLNGPSCDGCSGGAEFIERVYNKGGRIEAGPYVVSDVELEQLETSNKAPLYTGHTTTKSSAQTIYVPDQKTQHLKPAQTKYALIVIYTGDAWRMDNLSEAR